MNDEKFLYLYMKAKRAQGEHADAHKKRLFNYTKGKNTPRR